MQKNVPAGIAAQLLNIECLAEVDRALIVQASERLAYLEQREVERTKQLTQQYVTLAPSESVRHQEAVMRKLESLSTQEVDVIAEAIDEFVVSTLRYHISAFAAGCKVATDHMHKTIGEQREKLTLKFASDYETAFKILRKTDKLNILKDETTGQRIAISAIQAALRAASYEPPAPCVRCHGTKVVRYGDGNQAEECQVCFDQSPDDATLAAMQALVVIKDMATTPKDVL